MITIISRMKKSAVLLLKLAVTIGVFGWLLAKIDLNTFMNTVRSVSPMALSMAAILTGLQALCAAVRWHFILRYLGAPNAFARTLQMYWIGLFATTLLPGGVAGDGLRMWVLARAGTKVSTSINSVLFDRLAALAGLVLLVAGSLPFIDDRVAAPPLRYGVPILLLIGLAVAFTIGLCIRIPSRWQHFRVARAVIALVVDLGIVCRPPLRLVGPLTLSILAIAGGALAIFLLLRSLGGEVRLLDCMVLAPLIILVTTLPISLGGWGLREGTMVGLFGLIGVAPAISLSVSILIGLLSTAISIPGLFVWLRWRRATGLAPTPADSALPAWVVSRVDDHR